jgi:hypothetical protein
VGAIIGSVVPVVGTGAGAAAGAKLALVVGKALLVSTIAAETLSVAKAALDLASGDQNEDEDEQDYEQIANSGIVLGITGALYIVGELAMRFARGVVNRVAGRVWRLPARRGQGTISRGDVIEVRVVTAARVLGLLRRYSVTWLESIRRNFPVIDLTEGGQIRVIPRPGRAPLYEVDGARIISVKSTEQLASAAEAEIRSHVRELANFSTRGNVSVVNPTSRVLMVAIKSPLDAAATAALEAYASARGVVLKLFGSLPPNHPAVIFPETIPVLMSEPGIVAAENVNAQDRSATERSVTVP